MQSGMNFERMIPGQDHPAPPRARLPSRHDAADEPTSHPVMEVDNDDSITTGSVVTSPVPTTTPLSMGAICNGSSISTRSSLIPHKQLPDATLPATSSFPSPAASASRGTSEQVTTPHARCVTTSFTTNNTNANTNTNTVSASSSFALKLVTERGMNGPHTLDWTQFNSTMDPNLSTIDHISSLERAFCSNFTCCHRQFADLHTLLDHFEEAHVMVMGADGTPIVPGKRSTKEAQDAAAAAATAATPAVVKQPHPIAISATAVPEPAQTGHVIADTDLHARMQQASASYYAAAVAQTQGRHGAAAPPTDVSTLASAVPIKPDFLPTQQLHHQPHQPRFGTTAYPEPTTRPFAFGFEYGLDYDVTDSAESATSPVDTLEMCYKTASTFVLEADAHAHAHAHAHTRCTSPSPPNTPSVFGFSSGAPSSASSSTSSPWTSPAPGASPRLPAFVFEAVQRQQQQQQYHHHQQQQQQQQQQRAWEDEHARQAAERERQRRRQIEEQEQYYRTLGISSSTAPATAPYYAATTRPGQYAGLKDVDGDVIGSARFYPRELLDDDEYDAQVQADSRKRKRAAAAVTGEMGHAQGYYRSPSNLSNSNSNSSNISKHNRSPARNVRPRGMNDVDVHDAIASESAAATEAISTSSASAAGKGKSNMGAGGRSPANNGTSASGNVTLVPPGTGRKREKAFKCPKTGCIKSYLNPNGLKYHIEKGTCQIDPALKAEQEQEQEQEQEAAAADAMDDAANMDTGMDSPYSPTTELDCGVGSTASSMPASGAPSRAHSPSVLSSSLPSLSASSSSYHQSAIERESLRESGGIKVPTLDAALMSSALASSYSATSPVLGSWGAVAGVSVQ